MNELGIRTYVVWIPMLDEDESIEVPKVSRYIAVSPQFFDGQKRVGDAAGDALDVEMTVWDAFLFYPPEATWLGHAMPAPAFAIAQVAGGVAGTRDTLPPLPDQAKLPTALAGKVAFIGAQRDFEVILRQVAKPFAERHRKR